jgi:hypothetical protein
MKYEVGHDFKDSVIIDEKHKLIGEFGGYYIINDIENDDILIYGTQVVSCKDIVTTDIVYKKVLGYSIIQTLESDLADVFNIEEQQPYITIGLRFHKDYLNAFIFKDFSSALMFLNIMGQIINKIKITIIEAL